MTAKASTSPATNLRIGVVVPHIFMQDEILPHVIFSPGQLALALCDQLVSLGHEVTLYTPGTVTTKVHTVTADLSLFQRELDGRNDSYIDLLKKHPFTFVTLARQVQSEIIAKAYQDANEGRLDIVHVYTNEEEIGLSFAQLCKVPVVFTHHDPFNFLIKYKNNFPKYAHLNWISMSYSQRKGMPSHTNWLANIYHGLDDDRLITTDHPANDYLVYMGRIIQPKGVHLAIKAVQKFNESHPDKLLRLKIAGKHYSDDTNDSYWQTHIEPALEDPVIEYVGFVSTSQNRQSLLANAKALIVPSLFEEPFGMVTIEAFACGTPVIGLDSGALPEVIRDGYNGFIAKKSFNNQNVLDEPKTIQSITDSIGQLDHISRADCRQSYLTSFTTRRMAEDHIAAYTRAIRSQDQS